MLTISTILFMTWYFGSRPRNKGNGERKVNCNNKFIREIINILNWTGQAPSNKGARAALETARRELFLLSLISISVQDQL